MEISRENAHAVTRDPRFQRPDCAGHNDRFGDLFGVSQHQNSEFEPLAIILCIWVLMRAYIDWEKETKTTTLLLTPADRPDIGTQTLQSDSQFIKQSTHIGQGS
jgi:hypothetical protein